MEGFGKGKSAGMRQVKGLGYEGKVECEGEGMGICMRIPFF